MSFIVGFTNKDDIEKQLQNEPYLTDKHYDIINDIKDNQVTKTEALHIFKDEMYWVAKDVVEDEYARKLFGYKELCNWLKDNNNMEDFFKKVNSRLDVWLEEFKQKIDGLNYLAFIEYDNGENQELKQIIPKLDCTIHAFVHH